jgi:hypothetical protein
MTRILRHCLPLLALVAAVAWLGAVSAADDDKDFTPLFNGKDLSGFKIELGKEDNEKSKTFTVKDGVIIVSGKPNGYFYTEKPYKNYVLRFDWKFVKDGNSGTLVHIDGPQKVWPKCVEVQGMQKDHGRIFAIGGAKGKFDVDKEAQKKAIKIGEWNTTEISSNDGKLVSKINGVEVSKGEGELKQGQIGWQSEGTELHFKNIKIKELK